jgi:hypothetical protein
MVESNIEVKAEAAQEQIKTESGTEPNEKERRFTSPPKF